MRVRGQHARGRIPVNGPDLGVGGRNRPQREPDRAALDPFAARPRAPRLVDRAVQHELLRVTLFVIALRNGLRPDQVPGERPDVDRIGREAHLASIGRHGQAQAHQRQIGRTSLIVAAESRNLDLVVGPAVRAALLLHPEPANVQVENRARLVRRVLVEHGQGRSARFRRLVQHDPHGFLGGLGSRLFGLNANASVGEHGNGGHQERVFRFRILHLSSSMRVKRADPERPAPKQKPPSYPSGRRDVLRKSAYRSRNRALLRGVDVS